MTSKPHTRPRDIGLILIGGLKLINGSLLVALGIGGLSLLNKDLVHEITRLADFLEISRENQTLQTLLDRAGLIRHSQLAWWSAITFAYAAALLAMGTGL